MQTILVLGAGLSSGSLIQYFLDQSDHGWKVRVGDINPDIAASRIKNHPAGEAFLFDVFNSARRYDEIKKADISAGFSCLAPLLAGSCSQMPIIFL